MGGWLVGGWMDRWMGDGQVGRWMDGWPVDGWKDGGLLGEGWEMDEDGWVIKSRCTLGCKS